MKFFTNGIAGMPKTNKYGSSSLEVDGLKFDSIKEANRYVELKYIQMAGDIKDLEVHPRFELLAPFTDCTGDRHKGIFYEADFRYYDKLRKKVVIEDTKGFLTEIYKIKRKLFMSRYFAIGSGQDMIFEEL